MEAFSNYYFCVKENQSFLTGNMKWNTFLTGAILVNNFISLNYYNIYVKCNLVLQM